MGDLLLKEQKNTDDILKNRELAVYEDAIVIHDGRAEGGNKIYPNELKKQNLLLNHTFGVNTTNGNSWQQQTSSVSVSNRWSTSIGGTVLYNAAALASGAFLLNTRAIELQGNSFIQLTQQFDIGRQLAGELANVTIEARDRQTESRIYIELGYGDVNDTIINYLPIGNMSITTLKKSHSLSFTFPDLSYIGEDNLTLYGSIRIWVASGSGFDSRTGGIAKKSDIEFFNVSVSIGKSRALFSPNTYSEDLLRLGKYEFQWEGKRYMHPFATSSGVNASIAFADFAWDMYKSPTLEVETNFVDAMNIDQNTENGCLIRGVPNSPSGGAQITKIKAIYDFPRK